MLVCLVVVIIVVAVAVVVVVVVVVVSYASVRDVAGDSLSHSGKRAEHDTKTGTTTNKRTWRGQP